MLLKLAPNKYSIIGLLKLVEKFAQKWSLVKLLLLGPALQPKGPLLWWQRCWEQEGEGNICPTQASEVRKLWLHPGYSVPQPPGPQRTMGGIDMTGLIRSHLELPQFFQAIFVRTSRNLCFKNFWKTEFVPFWNWVFWKFEGFWAKNFWNCLFLSNFWWKLS